MTAPPDAPDATPGASPNALSAGGATRRRLGVPSELTLVSLPVVVVLVVFWFVERLAHHQLLFTSLAASAFLIYLDPLHRMNRVGTLAAAQLSAAGLGFAAAHLGGAGYASSSAAMVAVIVLMVALDRVHPPAVSTVLAFSLQPTPTPTLGFFGLAVGMTTLLVLLSIACTRLLRRLTHSGRKPLAEAATEAVTGG